MLGGRVVRSVWSEKFVAAPGNVRTGRAVDEEVLEFGRDETSTLAGQMMATGIWSVTVGKIGVDALLIFPCHKVLLLLLLGKIAVGVLNGGEMGTEDEEGSEMGVLGSWRRYRNAAVVCGRSSRSVCRMHAVVVLRGG